MGYKMKGFTYPGKSPVKQNDDGLSSETTVGKSLLSSKTNQEEEGGPSPELLDEFYRKQLGLDKKPTLEDKYTEEGVSKKEGLPEGTEEYLESQGEDYNMWKDPKLRKSITDPVAKEKHEEALKTPGLEKGEVPTDKAQIKQQKTKSKIAQKTSGKSDKERGFGKVAQTIRQTGKEKKTKEGKWLQKTGRKLVGISGKERATTKVEKLKGKEELAKATGRLSVTADALTGFKVTPQADKLKKRIKTKEAGIKSKKTRKDTKKIKADAKPEKDTKTKTKTKTNTNTKTKTK